MTYIPNITIRGKEGHLTSTDALSALYQKGIIFISGPIDFNTSISICGQLLTLSNILPSNQIIRIIINSPGGMVVAARAIIDVMHTMKHIVATELIGMGYSAAASIFVCGTKGYRRISRRSYLMIHQVSGGMEGKAEDLRVYMEQTLREQNETIDILSTFTDCTREEIESMLRIDYYMDSAEAIKRGFADSIIEYEVMHNPILAKMQQTNTNKK